MTQPTTHRPPSILLSLIATLLAPTFLCVTGGDLTLAHMAAIETINDYRARNNVDLIAIAQIIACGLAALGSLSQSMEDDISLSMTLRLRGNAVALNRSAEQNRRVLTQPLRDNPTPHETAPNNDATFLSPTAAKALEAEAESRLHDQKPTQEQPATEKTPEKRHQEMWAIALVNEASEITASIPHLPPAERPAASIRAAALSSTANELLTGASSPTPLPHREP
jgi:hypothetical protein